MGNITAASLSRRPWRPHPFVPKGIDVSILRAVRDYGFLDNQRLFVILQRRGFEGTKIWMRKRILLLSDNGYIHIAKRAIRNKIDVCFITPGGLEELQKDGLGLPYHSDARNDAATYEHFMVLADIANKIHDEVPVGYWLTDFQVRSENQKFRERGFAKDYDAVFQTYVDEGPLTVAVEYERVRKSKKQFWEISKSYPHDKYVQMVLVVVGHASWIRPMAETVAEATRASGILYFVPVEELLVRSLERCTVSHLFGNQLNDDWLYKCMEVASRTTKVEYTPRFSYRLP